MAKTNYSKAPVVNYGFCVSVSHESTDDLGIHIALPVRQANSPFKSINVFLSEDEAKRLVNGLHLSLAELQEKMAHPAGAGG